MFSTALDTIKFLSDTRPMIGFSSIFGTATFLAPSLANWFGSGILIVPVPFNLNVPAFGLAAPFGRPNVLPVPL